MGRDDRPERTRWRQGRGPAAGLYRTDHRPAQPEKEDLYVGLSQAAQRAAPKLPPPRQFPTYRAAWLRVAAAEDCINGKVTGSLQAV